MNRDQDVQVLATAMHSRLFPYIKFANPPVRATPSSRRDVGDIAVAVTEAAAVTASAQPAVAADVLPQFQAAISAAPEPPRMQAATPPTWSPLAAPAPEPVMRETATAGYPLIQKAVQEARDIARAAPVVPSAESTLDWLRGPPSTVRA